MNNGPYATREEAFAEAVALADSVAMTDLRAGRPTAPRGEAIVKAARAIFVTSLEDLELGAYDQQIVDWLAGWDIETLVVLGGIIERAKAMRPR